MISRQQNPYQTISPDVWSECLSYLPPDELSKASEILPLTPNTNQNIHTDAEHAAWLALRSMVEIAEKYWDEEERHARNSLDTKQTRNSDGEEENDEEPSRDAQAFELQKLVSENTSILGDLLRASTASRRGEDFFRFRDETWQDLYELLYRVLCESDSQLHLIRKWNKISDIATKKMIRKCISSLESEEERYGAGAYDKSNIALAVGLIFGVPPLPTALMTRSRRKKLGNIARACSNEERINRNSRTGNHRHVLSDARCYLLSLRLAEEGLWDSASDILQSRSTLALGSKKDHQTLESINDDALLSIDGMIYTSTFLIDRLYSQTYVRRGKDDEELMIAIRLGRKAVVLSKKRYCAYKTRQFNTNGNIESWSLSEDGTKTALQTSNLPPSPIQSLFANDALRYINANLALGKALALVAQHVALQASNIEDLRTGGVLPLLGKYRKEVHPDFNIQTALQAEDDQVEQMFKNFPQFLEIVKWVDSFFEESRQRLEDGIAVIEEQLECKENGNQHLKWVALFPLKGALISANAERDYCAGCAAYHLQKSLRLNTHIPNSIRGFSQAFDYLIPKILAVLPDAEGTMRPADQSCVEATIGILMRCGKDLGKTCGFADVTSVNYKAVFPNHPGLLGQLNAQQILDFSLMVSIFRHGSFHPTTKNIQRLSNQDRRIADLADNNQQGTFEQSLSQKYRAVATWLVANYGYK